MPTDLDLAVDDFRNGLAHLINAEQDAVRGDDPYLAAALQIAIHKMRPMVNDLRAVLDHIRKEALRAELKEV